MKLNKIRHIFTSLKNQPPEIQENPLRIKKHYIHQSFINYIVKRVDNFLSDSKDSMEISDASKILDENFDKKEKGVSPLSDEESCRLNTNQDATSFNALSSPGQRKSHKNSTLRSPRLTTASLSFKQLDPIKINP